MDKIIIMKAIFPLLVLWGIAMILLWIRPKIEIFWKIVATLLYVFYIWFFFDEIQKGFLSFKASWFAASVAFIKEFIVIIFFNLFILWPIALFSVFYKADDLNAERLLKFMCILTVILWIIFVIYVFNDRGIDRLIFQKLKHMIPFVK